MKLFYNISLHTINLLFLATILVFIFFSFVNISDNPVSVFNPVTIGFNMFLLLFWAINYTVQIVKRKNPWFLLIGVCLYIIPLICTFTVYPFLYNYINY